jgi:hypothetical protein
VSALVGESASARVGESVSARVGKSASAPVGESASARVGESVYSNTGQTHRSAPSGEHAGSPLRRVVQWFKTMTTNEYIRGVKQHGWPPFPGKLWQRNYWDHIIRNESDLNRIREYIRNNSITWELDALNAHIRHGPTCPPES